MAHLPSLPLPPSISTRQIDLTQEPTCGLSIHILESGPPTAPLILLLHGYPELAFTYRKLLPLLASSNKYHVVAPDSRGYGRTTGWDSSSHAHTNMSQFTTAQLVQDNVALVRALGHARCACVVGHDFGVNAAAGCALVRPDMFSSVVFMSHCSPGASPLPTLAGAPPAPASTDGLLPREKDVHAGLAKMGLVHYQWYNSTAKAAQDWACPEQGMRAFLRGYVHLKSAAWSGHDAATMGRLKGWTADELSRMPGYYIMPVGKSMPEVVAEGMRGEDAAATAHVVSDDELDVYAAEFARTGFQGMLNWYRASTAGTVNQGGMALVAGRKFEVPVVYIGGVADWGNYQRPGALEALEAGRSATDYRGTKILPGAGHWPQTEIPEVVCEEICRFLDGI